MAIKASYSEIYDLQTKENAISALKIHTPQDGAPARHLGGMIAQFRRYKYLGANVALVPAQTLPLDPLQVSYDAGDQLADPRDILNPILHKHYSGERTLLDLFLDGYFTKKIRGQLGIGHDAQINPGGQSIDETEIPTGGTPSVNPNPALFYGNMLMDNSWRAAHVQAGLRIKVRPFVWDVQSTRPLSSATTGQTNIVNPDYYVGLGKPEVAPVDDNQDLSNEEVRAGRIRSYNGPSDTNLVYKDDWQFIGSGTMPLNWLPTNNTISAAEGTVAKVISEVTRFRIPKIYMHMIILPPAFKTSFYYRLVVKHKFLFKDMSSLASIDSIDAQAAYERKPKAYTAPTAKSRLETIGVSSEHDEGYESSMEAIGIDMRPMGSVFQYGGDVEDDYMDIAKAPNIKTMDEKIKEIIEEDEDRK